MTAKQLKALSPLVPQSDGELTLVLRDTITAQTTREEAIALRDAKIAEMRKTLEDKYGYDALIANCERDIERGLALTELWAAKNKARFGELKSLTLAGVRLGWRGMGWKTALLSRVTWARAVEFLDELSKRGAAKDAGATAVLMGLIAERFLRRKIEPNKDEMIAARDDAAAMEVLLAAGVMIETEDAFFIRREGEGQQEATLKAA